MQGLDKNRYQFALLVLVNAFVGAMLGLERSIMPDFGKLEFGINANTAAIAATAGMIANRRMCCTNKLFWKSDYCVPVY